MVQPEKTCDGIYLSLGRQRMNEILQRGEAREKCGAPKDEQSRRSLREMVEERTGGGGLVCFTPDLLTGVLTAPSGVAR